MNTKIAPIIFLLLILLLTNNIHALDTNIKKVDNFQCLGSGTITTQSEGENIFSYNTAGFAYALFNPWFKGDSETNSTNLPFLLQSANVNSIALLIHTIEDINGTDDFKLKYTSYQCDCPSGNGTDKFGQCVLGHEDVVEYNNNMTALELCTNEGQVPNATVTSENLVTSPHSFGGGDTIANVYDKTWTRNSSNTGNLYYLYKDGPWGTMAFVNAFNQPSSNELQYSQSFTLDRLNFDCSCPSGYTKNSIWNYCEPFDCAPPLQEISSGVCAVVEFCNDGAPKYNGTCDRPCSQVDYFTTGYDDDNNILTPEIERCSLSPDCDKIASDCVTQCGNIDNVEYSPLCTTSTGVSGSCQCKDDTIDDIVDNETADETTEAGDSLLTNKYLKSIKDELLNQGEMQDEISSLLQTGNQNDLDRNTKLDSIDGKLNDTNNKLSDIDLNLTGINNKISDVDDSVNNMNNNLGGKLEEGNGLLNDIKTNTRDNADSSQGMLDKIEDLFTTSPETLQDEIGDNLTILDDIFSEYGTFKDNLTGQYEAVVDLGSDANDTINGGFTSIFNGHVSEVSSCKQSFQVDFSGVGASMYNIEVDPCNITSMLRPIFYPIFYIVFTISVFIFALNLFRGVL